MLNFIISLIKPTGASNQADQIQGMAFLEASTPYMKTPNRGHNGLLSLFRSIGEGNLCSSYMGVVLSKGAWEGQPPSLLAPIAARLPPIAARNKVN